MGRIGSRYAELVRALGAELVYTSPRPKPEAERGLGAKRAELDELLRASDVVSIHAPASEETHHLIGAAELDLIGPEGVLVNTSRGPLVDADAVSEALQEGRLGAAGLDVYEGEPEVPPSCLTRRARCCCPTSARRPPLPGRHGAHGGGERDRGA